MTEDMALTWDEVARKVKGVLDRGFHQDFIVAWERTDLVVTVNVSMNGQPQAMFWRFKYIRDISLFMQKVVEDVSASFVNIPVDPPLAFHTDPHF